MSVHRPAVIAPNLADTGIFSVRYRCPAFFDHLAKCLCPIEDPWPVALDDVRVDEVELVVFHCRQSRPLLPHVQPNEILRISRTKGNTPTHILNQQAQRMIRISKIASKSGTVLSIVGLGVACHEIAQTEDTQKKNEIFVENLGSFVVGVGYGIATTAGILFAATPVGWVAALVIAAGGVAYSYLGGKLAKEIYISKGRNIDLVSLSHADGLCR